MQRFLMNRWLAISRFFQNLGYSMQCFWMSRWRITLIYVIILLLFYIFFGSMLSDDYFNKHFSKLAVLKELSTVIEYIGLSFQTGLKKNGNVMDERTASHKSPFRQMMAFLLYTSELMQRNGTKRWSAAASRSKAASGFPDCSSGIRPGRRAGACRSWGKTPAPAYATRVPSCGIRSAAQTW